MREKPTCFLGLLIVLISNVLAAQPPNESAGSRGVVALPDEEGTVSVAWRLLVSDSSDRAFHVYRKDLYSDSGFQRVSESPVVNSTRFTDRTAMNGYSYRYRVYSLAGGLEIASLDSAYVTSTDWHRPYVAIALEGNYEVRSVALGDLDGDGVMDLVIKQPNFNTDPYHRQGYWKRSSETYKLEAYSGSSGKFLWRYDMGWAIETGAWYSPYVVYDLDQDGRAEVFTKAGEGDPREIDGRVVSGPEYLVQLNGLTGEVERSVPWHSRQGWESYNRSMRNMLAVAYLDGRQPSLIMQRGTYDLMKTSALDRDLRQIWYREARNPHDRVGPGTHGLITADVDEDARDELVLGSTVLDDNGTVLWATGLGHPDPCFVADIDPANPGLEVFYGIEPGRPSQGVCLVSARNGKVLWAFDGPTRHVHSKGMIGDIDPRHPGIESYAGEQDGSQYWLYAADGTRISDQSFGTLSPYSVWWDDDLTKEVVVGNRVFKYPNQTVAEIEGRVLAIVDCLGDWREEIITSLPGEVRVYSSTEPSSHRFPWLMEDRQYRLGVAAGSMGYYREPQLGTALVR